MTARTRNRAPALPAQPPGSGSGGGCCDWYRRNGRDLPWRQTTRSVPHPRLRGHAAADAGRSRAAEVRRVAREIPDARGAGRRAGSGRRPRRGGRSATTSGRAGCTPSPASRSRATAASCRRDEATLRSFKGIGEYTAGAVLQLRVRPAQRRSSTPTSRACCSASSSARGDPKSHAMRRHLWDVSRTVLPMRHVFDFNQALMDFGATLCTARKPKCLRVPDARRLRRLSVRTARQESRRDARSRRIAAASSSRRRSSSVTARSCVTRRLRGRASRRLLGVPGRQVRGRRERIAACLRAGDSSRSSTRRSASDARSSRSPTPTPSASSSCTSSRAICWASRGRCSDRRCGGCARDELASLEFPPADEELILMLSRRLARRAP